MINKVATELDILTFFEAILDVQNLSPIQKITLKTIRGEELDTTTPIIKSHPYQIEDFANEVEMFKYFTGKSDYYPAHYSDASLCFGRRSGKCHAEGTEVLTPTGPKPIEEIKVGDDVYGFNADGSVSLTKVLNVFENGKKEVVQLMHSNKILSECTEEHAWATINEWKFRGEHKTVYGERKVKEFYNKDQYIRRAFVKIPCGVVHEPHAYAIGVMLGDGCINPNETSGVISSATVDVPYKVSKVLGIDFIKSKGDNYNYYMYDLVKRCNHYEKWFKDKKAHEKILDFNIINTWDRESCLALLAGLIDTDGSVNLSSNTNSLNLSFGCQSKISVEVFQKLFYKLWHHKLTIYVDDHKNYKNGKLWYVNCKSNLYTKMALKELDPYLVNSSKKWKNEYSDLPEQRNLDRIGVKVVKITRKTNTYDLEVGNDTHLYLLANEGLITHNSTTIGAGLAIYYATMFDYTPYLGTSPHATIPIISPTKSQAGEVYAAIKNFFLRSSWLFSKFLDGDIKRIQDEYSEEDIGKTAKITGGEIKLNNKVIIKVMAADVSKIRGMAVPFAILDEVCFFGADGNDTKNTDKAIYEALAPALSQFQTVEGMALVLKISSPNGQNGLMYNDYLTRAEEDILHFGVPTWYANPSISVKYLEKQKKKGMNYFNREYGAEYTASETAYLDPNLIEKTIIRGMEAIDPQRGYRYAAMIDYATRNDYWTFAVGHKEYVLDTDLKEKREKVYIDYLFHWQGTDGDELDPAEVVPEICTVLKKYQVGSCFADQYAFAALKGLFAKEGCTLKEFTQSNSSKIKMFYSLQVSLNSHSLCIVHNQLAIQQLKDLREKRSQSNKIQIAAANNSHDDYAVVIAGVVYQFDKVSPIYIGYHKDEEEDLTIRRDTNGHFLTTPTAGELAEHVGLKQFYDNSKEHMNKEDKEPDDDDGFWFTF